MLRPSRNMSVCLLGNDLYLMGGFGRHRVILDQVSKLSLLDRKYEEILIINVIVLIQDSFFFTLLFRGLDRLCFHAPGIVFSSMRCLPKFNLSH